MQQDVRRSDSTEGTRAEESPEKPGFARSLFRFGGKRKKESAAEPGKLTDRLKEVLERDRALIASQPPLEAAQEHHEVHHEVHDDEAWPEPFGPEDEAHTGTHTSSAASAALAWTDGGLDEPFAHPPQTYERSVVPPAQSAFTERRISQIASWIEEEITEQPEGAGPVALEAPLNADEAAELDAVLGSSETLIEPEPTLVTSVTQVPVAPAVVEPEKPRAPTSRAQVKAKVSARPAPREDPASKEPFNTLTMARLLAMQGYKPRALTVYRELLKRSPDDEVLRAEFEALKKSDG